MSKEVKKPARPLLCSVTARDEPFAHVWVVSPPAAGCRPEGRVLRSSGAHGGCVSIAVLPLRPAALLHAVLLRPASCHCASLDTPADAAPRASNAECCDEPSEDCSSGRPSTCNAGCARVLVPYFDDCGAALGKAARQFEDVVALCAEVNGMVSAAAGSTLAALVSAAAHSASCCSASLRGSLSLRPLLRRRRRARQKAQRARLRRPAAAPSRPSAATGTRTTPAALGTRAPPPPTARASRPPPASRATAIQTPTRRDQRGRRV